MKASVISLIVSILVLSIKTVAYYTTKSQAIFSDALETIVNVIAASVALWVLYVSQQPKDEDHPYGHGKIEYFSAAFEGGLVCFASIMIGAKAIQAFIRGEVLFKLEEGLLLLGAATFINLILGLYLKKEGTRLNSPALLGASTHVLSDIWTTVGSVISVGLVMTTGQLWIDAVVALLMAFLLLYSGYKIMRGSLGALMDEKATEELNQLAQVLNKNRLSGIIDFHEAKMIRSGHFHHIDVHLVVPQFWDITKAHELTHQYEDVIVKAYKFDGEIAFHLDPCHQRYCQWCDLEKCPIRKENFLKHREFSVESLTSGPLYSN